MGTLAFSILEIPIWRGVFFENTRPLGSMPTPLIKSLQILLSVFFPTAIFRNQMFLFFLILSLGVKKKGWTP